MTDTKAVMKMALDALLGAAEIDTDMKAAIDALCEAIAQPVPPAVSNVSLRDKFEVYASAKGFTLKRYESPEPTQYVHYNTQWAWEAYQEASPIAQPEQTAIEQNFCPRCGKRLAGDGIHTCTPPKAKQ